MRKGLAFFSMVFFVLLSCGDNQAAVNENNSESVNQEIKITQRAIEKFDYMDYVLSVNGEKAVMDWEKYQELVIQINYLKKADLSFFNGDKKLLGKFIDSFKVQIPDTLKTNSIVSRTVIVETSLLRLNENLTLENIDGGLKLEGVKEVLVAFSNLNYQINKKLERDIYEQIKSEY